MLKKKPLECKIAQKFEGGLMAESKFLLAELIMVVLWPVIGPICLGLVKKCYAHAYIPGQIKPGHTATPAPSLQGELCSRYLQQQSSFDFGDKSSFPLPFTVTKIQFSQILAFILKQIWLKWCVGHMGLFFPDIGRNTKIFSLPSARRHTPRLCIYKNSYRIHYGKHSSGGKGNR